jgi:4-diphosphocytidyl-2-C-methyl-D-erythritol kinase
MNAWCLPAFAKVNLGLRILGKRPDGYHDLETYFLQIDLADKLFFEKSPDFLSTNKSRNVGMQLTCNMTDIPIDESNLCCRAYQLFCEAAGRQLSVRLHLEKNIPAGAGLGGGSSDAAVTLMALNCLFDLGLPDTILHRLAAQVGSDVPFFLTGGLCLGRGRGEIITPLPELPDFWILVITPPIVVSTAWAYQKYKIGLTNRQKSSTLSSFDFGRFGTLQLREVCQNDLAAGVFEAYPELASIRTRLEQSGALVASMTGSGSAVYGVFRTQQEAHDGQQFFQKDYTTHVTRPIRWGIRQVDADYAHSRRLH